MLHIALVLSASALVLVGGRLPAAAADTSYLTLQGNNPYNGSCPVTLTFTGSIVGPARTGVTYLFSHFVNGQAIDSPPVATVIPGTGTLNIAPAQLTVDAAHAGLQSYQLLITSPAGSDSTSHGKVFFTVNCVAATPQPPPGVRNGVNESPANVAAINDLSVCEQHAPGTACGFILTDARNSNSLVLAWDVAHVVDLLGHSRLSAPDGFKVYRVDGGRHDLITKQPFEYVRVAEVPKPADGTYDNKCYAVTAYNSLAESQASKPFCGANGALGIVLSPKTIAARDHWHHRGLYYPPTGCNGLCVGYELDSSNGTDFGDQSGIAWRSYLRFDQGSLAGIHVTRATLKVLTSYGDAGCIDKVSAANGDWWDNNSAWVDGDFDNGVAPSAANRSGALIDVTRIVQRWADGSAPNNGLVITGRDENVGANQTAQCITVLRTNAVLDIER